MRPVKLSVHRNTAERRRRRQASADLIGAAKRHAGDKQIVGYALVTWDSGWNARSDWSTGGAMPGNVMPEFIKRALERAVGSDDATRAIWGPSDRD